MDSRDTVLILGAGNDQVHPIKIAKEMGIRTLAVDIDSSAKGFNYADAFALISNRDINALKNLCDKSAANGNKVKGVFLMGSDIPNIQAELAEYLKIYGPSKETAKVTTNKFLMKEVLRKKNIPIPWYKLVKSSKEILYHIEQTNFDEFVIKPVDNSGSRGVFLFKRDSNEIQSLYNLAKKESLCGDVLIEEYIPGKQISTESIIINGEVFTPGFVDRNYEMLEKFYPNIIENGGSHPSEVNTILKKSIYNLVEKATKALGIINGNAKGDIVIDKKGEPMIIEMASRLSGGDFSESLIPLGCGVDIVRSSLNLCLGKVINSHELEDKFVNFVANRYFFERPGYLKSIKVSIDIKNLSWLKKFEIYYKPGDFIKEITSHASRIGVFVVIAESKIQLEERINLIYSKVKFVIN